MDAGATADSFSKTRLSKSNWSVSFPQSFTSRLFTRTEPEGAKDAYDRHSNSARICGLMECVLINGRGLDHFRGRVLRGFPTEFPII